MKAVIKNVSRLCALVVILPAMASACPDLTGDYVCSVGPFSMNIPVTQSVNKGVTTYVIDSAPVIVDGQTHHADTLPAIMARFVSNVDYAARCDSEAVVAFGGTGTMISSGEQAQVSGTLEKVDATSANINLLFQTKTRTRNINASCIKN